MSVEGRQFAGNMLAIIGGMLTLLSADLAYTAKEVPENAFKALFGIFVGGVSLYIGGRLAGSGYSEK